MLEANKPNVWLIKDKKDRKKETLLEKKLRWNQGQLLVGLFKKGLDKILLTCQSQDFKYTVQDHEWPTAGWAQAVLLFWHKKMLTLMINLVLHFANSLEKK